MLDPVCLQSFVAVADTLSFSAAARRLGLRQSTVSQHVRRLEEAVGRRLFQRDTHRVAPTGDGDALLTHARLILEAHERAQRQFAEPELRGRVRLGAAEDLVLSRLPDVLRAFRRRHAAVDLELTVGLSDLLYERLDEGALDLVLGKRRPGETRGRLIHRERLAWVGIDAALAAPAKPLPLILFPEPSIIRALVLDALARAGRPWRIVCTSSSLSGLRAAALAGLGITVQSATMISLGLDELSGTDLPRLADTELVVVGRRVLSRPAATLFEMLARYDYRPAAA